MLARCQNISFFLRGVPVRQDREDAASDAFPMLLEPIAASFQLEGDALVWEPKAPTPAELKDRETIWMRGEPMRGWPGARGGALPDVSRMRGALERFVALEHEKPAAVRTFAQRYGVLGLCQHGLPMGHEYHPRRRQASEECRFTRREPIAIWHRFSREVGALYRLGQALKHGARGDLADWRTAWETSRARQAAGRGVPLLPLPEAAPGRTDHEDDAAFKDAHARAVNEEPRAIQASSETRRRAALEQHVSAILDDAAVRVAFRWDRVGPRLAIVGTGALAPVGLQLGAMLGGSAGVAVCAGCGQFFERKGGPPRRASARVYCATCRASGVAKRLAHRRWKEQGREGGA